ncbi:MAG: hypothetical protein PVF83_03355 [Anaerolineales bacterium]|jgi:hypothetical protein
MSNKKQDIEFDFFVSIASLIRKDIEKHDKAWDDSPLEWIKNLPAGAKGKLGKQLVASWCAAKGLLIDSSSDPEADIVFNRHRVEIKFSTLWESGIYKFQQIRDQDYEYIVCLGISPFAAHCWVISKEILRKNVIGHTPQHTGARGTETFWFSVNPNNPPEWLSDCGGTLEEAFVVLQKLSPRRK